MSIFYKAFHESRIGLGWPYSLQRAIADLHLNGEKDSGL